MAPTASPANASGPYPPCPHPRWRTPRARTAWACFLGSLLALSLAGCGGGGDESASPTLQDAEQARRIVALAWALPNEVAAIGSSGTLASLFASTVTEGEPVVCHEGVSVFDGTDAGPRGELNEGDELRLDLQDCLLETDRPRLTGRFTLAVTGPTHAAVTRAGHFWEVDATFDHLRAGALTFVGHYGERLNLDRAANELSYDVEMTAVEVRGGPFDARVLRWRHVQERTIASNLLSRLEGRVELERTDLGALSYDIVLVGPVDLRTHPTVVRLTGTTGSLLVSEWGDGRVHVVVDNGDDGSIDLEFDSSVTELQAVLRDLSS